MSNTFDQHPHAEQCHPRATSARATHGYSGAASVVSCCRIHKAWCCGVAASKATAACSWTPTPTGTANRVHVLLIRMRLVLHRLAGQGGLSHVPGLRACRRGHRQTATAVHKAMKKAPTGHPHAAIPPPLSEARLVRAPRAGVQHACCRQACTIHASLVCM